MIIVMLGSSYRLIAMSRAGAAHSSPRRKAGSVLICGWVEKRAEIEQTARTSTGGNVPALIMCKYHTPSWWTPI